MEFLFFLGSIVPLLIIGGIIALIVVAVRRFSDPEHTESPGTAVRRFFQYLLMLVALILAAFGISELLAAVLPSEGTVIAETEDAARLARPLAFVIVGTPVFLLLWRFTRRRIEENPAERASLGWSFYVTAAELIALVIAMVTAVNTLGWLFGTDDYSASAVAFFVVWTSVWAGHWVVGHDRTEPRRMRLHLAAGSAAGLWTTASAAGVALGVSLVALYDQVFSTVMVGSFSELIREALAAFIVGAAVWWWYWWMNYARTPRSPLWNGYVLIAGVLVGLITMIGSLAAVLFIILEWFFGSPEQTTAASHFEAVPAAAAAALVGFGVWWYHRAVIQSAPSARRQEVDRIYQYLVAGIGLAASATGIVIALVALIESISGDVIVGSGSADTLLGAITALIVGVPVWWTSWSSIQRHAATDPEPELTSPSRRIYLFLVFGVGGLISVVSLIILVAQVSEDLLNGDLGSATLYDARVPIALLITVGVIAWYHWVVFQADRSAAPHEERPAPTRQVTLLAPPGFDTNAIAEAAHATVRVLARTDEVTPDAEAVIAALEGVDADRVLVVTVDSGEVFVVPVAGSW